MAAGKDDILTPSQIAALREAVGGAVLLDPEQRADYSADRSPAHPTLPAAVCLPTTTGQVSALAAVCQREGLPLSPRGTGTGKAGGCVPSPGGIVCGLERLAGVQQLAPEDQQVRVLPGTITGDLRRAVEDIGWFYPPDPASLDECTIGGNVATNAGGPLCVKYGVTGDYVLGAEVVLADGRVVRTGRRSIKGVAGLDLTSLLVGSEGTLGILTEITLRIRPRPATVEAAWVTFPSSGVACHAVNELLGAGILPRALELVDAIGLAALGLPGGAALLVEMDGPEGTARADMDRVVTRLAGLASDVQRADGDDAREALWQQRRSISDAIKEGHAHHLSEDVAVPTSQLPALLERLERVRKDLGVTVAAYGHAGDGNLHVNLLYDDSRDHHVVIQASESIFRAALELGGTLTGEHGIGQCKRPYLAWEIGDEQLRLQRRLKAVFDPTDILNPGKIFEPPP